MNNNFKDNMVITLISLGIIAAGSLIFLIELLLAIVLTFIIGMGIIDWLFGMLIADLIGFIFLWNTISNIIINKIPGSNNNSKNEKDPWRDEYDNWHEYGQ